MGKIMEFLGNLLKLVAWGNIKIDLQTLIEGNEPKRVALAFVEWINNGCRLVIVTAGKLIVDRTKPFNPAKFIGAGWTIWKGPAGGQGLEGEEEQDTRSLVLNEIDWSQVRFEHMLRDGETMIKGEEKLRQLKELGHIRLDAKVGEDLMNEPGRITLAMLRNRGIKWIDFMGTILRSPFGYRYVLSLYCGRGGRWFWDYYWLDVGWYRQSPSAVLANTLVSVPAVP